VAIDQLAGRKVSIYESIEAFSKGFEKALEIQLEPYVLTEAQLLYVEEIERKKYGNIEWTFKK
ncbi:hypothetical protein J4G37_62350, partial [Microvirga sp. 3-52]|nr:hypothetical protein [Microvirga sp. 3-52]